MIGIRKPFDWISISSYWFKEKKGHEEARTAFPLFWPQNRIPHLVALHTEKCTSSRFTLFEAIRLIFTGESSHHNKSCGSSFHYFAENRKFLHRNQRIIKAPLNISPKWCLIRQTNSPPEEIYIFNQNFPHYHPLNARGWIFPQKRIPSQQRKNPRNKKELDEENKKWRWSPRFHLHNQSCQRILTALTENFSHFKPTPLWGI